MDVRLSAEQVALRDTATQIVDRHGVKAVGELDDAERRAKLESAVAATGWRELRVPDDDGRPLASGVEVAIVAEALGRGLADVAFIGPVLASELRRRAGAPWVEHPEAVMSTPDLGEILVAADGRLPVGATAIDVHSPADALLIRSVADKFELARIRVEPALRTSDLTRPVARIGTVERVQSLEDRHLLADDDITAVTALGLAVTCADLVGVMRGANQLAREYAAERTQYDTPIGSFQAVQHLLADAHVAAEGAASVALHAAWAVDALPPDEALAAGAVAKAYCARAARAVCETSIQVHGGIGNTWECLAHLYLRRALLSGDAFGGIGVNLDRVLRSRGVQPEATRSDDGLR